MHWTVAGLRAWLVGKSPNQMKLCSSETSLNCTWGFALPQKTWSRNLGWPLKEDKNDAGFVAGWLQSANVCGRIVPCPGGSLNICDSVERGWFSSYLPGRAWKILQEWLLVENDLQILASILPAQCFVDQRIQWISRQRQQKGLRMQDFWAVNLSIYLCRQNLGHRS